MIQKIIPSAHASSTSFKAVALSPFAKYLLEAKRFALLQGIIITDDLISEINSFAERNNAVSNSKALHTSCPHCLKAHAISSANELGLDSRAKSFIDALLEGETGHDGYYLDKDKLIKLENTLHISRTPITVFN